MSYGTTRPFKSKKALKDYVAEHGADAVTVFDTSIFDNKGTVKLSMLADMSAVIVGPDVYQDRKWFANVKIKKDGTIVVV